MHPLKILNPDLKSIYLLDVYLIVHSGPQVMIHFSFILMLLLDSAYL